MKSLISIIILPFENNIYLGRCLQSIVRQDYSDYEIIIVDKHNQLDENVNQYSIQLKKVYKEVNQAILNASGEYILFVNATDILAPNYIERILVQNPKIWKIARCLKYEGQSFIDKTDKMKSLAGKLFERNVILENNMYDASKFLPEIIFLLKYSAQFEKIEVDDDLWFYNDGLKEKFLNLTENFNIRDVYNLIDIINNELYSDEEVKIFYEELIKQILESDNNEKEIIAIWTAEKLMGKYSGNLCLNFDISQNYLKPIFNLCLNEKNNILWNEFKNYFMSPMDNNFQKILYKIYDLTDEKIQLLNKYSIDEYLFYVHNLDLSQKEVLAVKINDITNTENDELGIKIEQIYKIVEDISKKVDVYDANKKNDIDNAKELMLSGSELGDYVVKEYSVGHMGFKYIMKFFKAWLNNKLNRQ